MENIQSPGESRPRLSLKEKIGYSLGDMASNLYFQIFVAFIPIFYTDVFGLPAAVMGTMLLVPRILDAITDPIMGMIADRTKSRWGKFRPYLLLIAPFLAIGGVLTFTTPGFGETGMLVYAYATYIFLVLCYTAINVPYSALMGVMTPNSLERTEVSSFRFVAAFAGQFVVNSTLLWLVITLGRGNEQAGWQLTMLVYGILAVVLMSITFFASRERILPPKTQQSNVKLDLKELFKNKAWLFIGIATLLQLTYIVMRSSAIPYYFRYYVMDQELVIFGRSFEFSYTVITSAFLTSGTVVTLIGAILTKFFTKRIDKKQIYSLFLLSSGLISCLLFFMQPNNLIPMFAINLVASFLLGSVSVIQWAIYTDTADYGEWKFGRRNTGLIMAASLFALKLGLTLGGAIVGWMLEIHGFVSGIPQSEDTLVGIRLLLSIYPAIFAVVAGLLIIFKYPLSDKKMVEIEKDLTARRAK